MQPDPLTNDRLRAELRSIYPMSRNNCSFGTFSTLPVFINTLPRFLASILSSRGKLAACYITTPGAKQIRRRGKEERVGAFREHQL